MDEPAIIDVDAPLHMVRTQLVGLGAQTEQRSVVLSMGGHLLILASESDSQTTIAIGGAESETMATWLIHQLAEAQDREVRPVDAKSTLGIL